jgi:hypothetical protein
MPDYRIRQATVSDAPVIARHRVNMFQDMGELPPDDAPVVESASRSRESTSGGSPMMAARLLRAPACCSTSTIRRARTLAAGPPRTFSTSIRSRDIDDKASRVNLSRRSSYGAVLTTSRARVCTRLGSAGRCTSNWGLRPQMR